MKKLDSFIGIVVIMFLMTLTAFAGDVPEALGYEDHAQIFIGTLKDFSIDNSSDSKAQEVQVFPTHKIKGDVPINELQTYELCYFGKVTPEKDKEYLFGWLADNSVWVYAIESYDKKDIKLQITDEFAERIQDSLENGIYARLEHERATLGTQISFAEFLYPKPMAESNVKKVTLRYQDELHEADVDEFEKIAKEIMITNVKNEALHDLNAKPKQPDPYKTNLYIELLDGNDQMVSYAAVSRHGEVDRYSLMMSRLMNKDYEMKKEALLKLYSLFPKDVQKKIENTEYDIMSEETAVPKKNYTPWIYGGGIAVFAIAVIIGFAFKKRKNKVAMRTKWNEKSTADKIILMLRIVISVVVLAGAILQITGVWDKALNIAVPLLSVLILIQSIQEHKEQKKASAIIGYVCFAVMAVMIIGALFVK